MSNLTAQINDINVEIEALLSRVDELTAKRDALQQLESTYTDTIELVKDTATLMVKAGLDPKMLAQDIRDLIAPRKKRNTTNETVDTDSDDEYEVIEVETAKKQKNGFDTLSKDDKKVVLKLYNDFKKAGHSGIQGISKLIFAATDYSIQLEAIAEYLTELETTTPQPTAKPVQAKPVETPQPTLAPAPVAINTKVRTYRVDPKTLNTPEPTPQPTQAPVQLPQELSKWTMQQLIDFCKSNGWHQSEIDAFVRTKGYKPTDKTGYILIASKIKAMKAGLTA